MNKVEPVKTLDCRDFSYPMPLVQAKEALEQVDAGSVIKILCKKEEETKKLLQQFTSQTGDQILMLKQSENVFTYYIQKASEDHRKEPTPFPNIITNEELEQKITQREKVNILDVREEVEFMLEHIPEAINIPLGELYSRVSELDKSQIYYVICRTGNRSDIACQLLEKLGFTKVFNVLPGMIEWKGSIED